jgi:hypothetical protein
MKIEGVGEKIFVQIIYLIVIFTMGFLVGAFVSKINTQEDAIRHNCATYDQNTAKFEWNNKEK